MNKIDLILQSITHMPSFPAVIHRVLELVENPKTSAKDVVEVIQYDQATTANVLRVCNSAYFGPRKPVHSLNEALVRIGFNQLMEIVLSKGTASFFTRACQGYHLEAGELRRHSVASAILSQILAQQIQKETSPLQFTTALLHDIGKLALSEFVRESFEEIRTLVRERKISFLEAEKEILGIDHAELGARIAEQWEFAPGIVAGIRFHHTPFQAPDFQDLVSMVHLCDVVALLTGFGGGADGLSYHGHKEIMQRFGLQEKHLERVISELDDRLKEAETLLNSP